MIPSPTQPRALVVEDEPVLAGLVATYLGRAGFETRTIGDGLSAVELVRLWSPQVIVLDLGLPGLDGVEVARQVRTFSDCYIVMLTARTEEVDVLVGLSVGADDYLTKPFSARELVARVQAMLRRPRAVAGPPAAHWVFGGLRIDPEARQVSLEGEQVALTATEFDLLAALAAQPRRVLTRAELVRQVWGGQWESDERLVDVHLGRVRRKLGDDAASPRFVITVRGVGYRMGQG